MKTIPIKESISMRPAMYIGSTDEKGIYTMLESFLLELIASSEIEEVEIQLNADNAIRIIASGFNVSPFVEKLNILKKGYEPSDEDALYKTLDLAVIICMSSKVHIEVYDAGKIYKLTGSKGDFEKSTDEGYLREDMIMEFTPDRNVFHEYKLDYEKINSMYERIAYINPDIKIMSVDDAHDEYQRRVFHYPKGLANKMDRLVDERSADEPLIRLDIEKAHGDFHYTFSFSFLDYPDNAYVQSFAGFSETLQHGSLVDGSVEGIAQAIQSIADKKSININISAKQIKENGFLFLASVLGAEYNFAGSQKLKLEMPDVELGAKEVVFSELIHYLEENEEKALYFINKF